jgi:hypothetical protein
VHGWHHLQPLDEGDAATMQAEGVAEHFGNLRKGCRYRQQAKRPQRM